MVKITHKTTGESGFTLLEVTVVLGLLASFVLFLTQILASSVELLDEGETGQELADLGHAAGDAAVGAMEDMVGPRWVRYERAPPDARLLVQWVPLGLSKMPTAASVQAVRASVRLSPVAETALLREKLLPRAQMAEGGQSDEEIAERLDDIVAATPRRERGEMLLMAWPSGDPDGAFVDLRRGLFLPGAQIPIGERRWIELMQIERPVEQLPPDVVPAITEPIATGLLHVEFAFRSQYTRSFDAPVGNNGPEWVWDSARAGLLLGENPSPENFSLDLGENSLENATDDVFPRAVRIILVVARRGREARLSARLGADDRKLQLLTTVALPDLDTVEFLKVGPEWIRVGSVNGNTLSGLGRGQRGTAAIDHERGTRVRAGKKIEIVVPLAHGRDSWNG